VRTPKLSVNIAGIEMKNPLMVGSGTYGNHGRFEPFFPVETLGALVPKTIRTYRWPGNPPPRVYECTGGLHSSVGIPCNDWDYFEQNDVPILKSLDVPIIQSVIGRSEAEYVEIVRRCSQLGIFSAIELNLSCPNTEQGGVDFGYDPVSARAVVARSCEVTDLPIIAKLAPDFSLLVAVAKAVEAGGAAAISMINAPRAMCIDHATLRPILGNKIGALSGAAIKPMAVYMVWEVYRAVGIPIIGMGGVADYRDVIEFMAAGAQAVAFGTINYVDPTALPRALDELTAYMRENAIDDVAQFVGKAHDEADTQEAVQVAS
jgi:dihydroorotate dehydrogenase (NAD+) catalytic subunit